MVGTPYRYGGASPAKGFDCSGLVLYSYGRAGVRLLHGNDFLIKASHPVTLGNLQRGDLVFFNERGIRNSHVGIYLGNGRFVHAPSSGKKVYVADLESRYWQRSFAQARRVTTD
jgi:cell wall-associated NlpC family hydrolase